MTSSPLTTGPVAARIWIALGLITAVFHIGLIFYGLVPNLVARPLHMALILPWVFLYAANTRAGWWSGAVITGIGVSGCIWIALNHQMLRNQYGFLENQFQVVLAISLLAIAMEGARRMIGWPLPLVAFCALLYGLYGQHIPGEFGHAGTPLRSFLGTLVVAEGGLWGSLTGVSVGVVAIFVIFGAVLNAGEAGQGFMNVASAAAGRLTGGAAKVSVLSSALFGSISGSASANVASTGAITLPAMTKLGYPKRLAAAVEAVASSGGQIMPPLMGAGAFVMVELTGVPYTQIMLAALLPAILYFLTVWMGINAYAQRFDLQAVPEDQRPDTRMVLITSVFFLVPFSVLLVAMFVAGFTPQYAAVLAIFAGAIALFFDATPRMDIAQGFERLGNALRAIGQQVAMIGAIIICASIIIGVLGITGLGIKITSIIISGSGGSLWPALLLTALACLLLGMEVPTTAAYVICVSVAGPALTELGLEPLQAHLFVFWFALLSTITPPVCGAVFIAAGMIGENWLRVALTAMALGLGLYIIPLAMIANPDLIRVTSNTSGAIIAFVMVGFGLTCLSYALIGKAGVLRRILLCVIGFAACFALAFSP
ncbi:TRAP transporter fused permease subunit [uncultured Sulfitobacter sp.]|uniref:TRAP transporter permease n=1 Tax=uncultured Sulfitobacter sp. TaxID=191468 RepID=UPI002637EA12|nr:TRAP transporter fused permease subunit [uncultured Sulfitobacter sp.]